MEPVRALAITSGKGGVGKTTFVLNLALSLSRRGRKVLVFDADTGLGNVHVFLGIEPRYNLLHVARGEKTLKEIIVKTRYGFGVIPAPSGIEELSQMDAHLKMEIVSEADDLERTLDYMLVDTAAGISSNVIYFCTASHEIVVIVTPEPTSIVNAYSLIKLLHTKYEEKSFRVVVNMVKRYQEGKETFSKLAGATEEFLGLSLDLMGIIPDDELVRRATLERKLALELNPGSPYSSSMEKMAERIEALAPPRPKGGIQFFWKRLLEA